MTGKTLGSSAVKWFENRRKIDAETVARYGVYTGSSDGEGRVVADPRGNVIVFPFIENGVEVGAKYRAENKRFWQPRGGKRTFWNADVLDDPALHDGRHPLIITEGEIDALTALDCGFPFTVSVPDGAPAVPEGKKPDDLEEIDIDRESSGKFEYLWNNRDRTKKIKRFVIASDADGPGMRLAAELVRRLSPVRCSFIAYPEGCKDLNDVLVKHGQEAVRDVINGAKPYPVRGLYRLEEYPEHEDLQTYTVGFDGWSNTMKVFLGEFIVVSGIPSHGKSTWTVNLIANLASAHGWRAAFCSPEMPTVPMLRGNLRRYFLGRKPMPIEVVDIKRADSWINRQFVFIDIDPTGTGESDEPFDLDWIIERATDAVLRDGIRVLCIDPWNEIEHARGKGENSADYIGRAIRALKRFARLYGVIVIVVAHPTKEVGKDGKQRAVTLYDIEGAAHWFNKCDHGIVVERPDRTKNEANIYIQKVRFEETGQPGKYPMTYDKPAGRFRPENVYSSMTGL